MDYTTSNQNLRVWVVLEPDIANPEAPTLAEVTPGGGTSSIDLSDALAWESFELAPSESSDIDARAVTDAATAVEAGFAEYGGTLQLYRGKDQDPNNPAWLAFQMFRNTRKMVYLIMRSGYDKDDALSAGDEVSVFKFMTTVFADNDEGDNPVAYTISFSPQGFVKMFTFISPAGTIDVPAAQTINVGDRVLLSPIELAGHNIRTRAKYFSDAPAIASVDEHGLVVGVSDGVAEITVSHPAGVSDTVDITVDP